MGNEEHVGFQYDKETHKGKKYGCVWRHASGYGQTPCHYAMNSYAVSGGRTGMYNEDHRSRAKTTGYTQDEETLASTGKIADVVGAAAGDREGAKRSKFMRKFQGRYHGPMHWLKLHPDGWKYGYRLAAQHKPKWDRRAQPPLNFEIYNGQDGGYGAWYPYFHNHHHMIPQGAVHQFVIDLDEGSLQRLALLLASKWNINEDGNMVMLPQEVFISAIVGLPAHCPWDMRSHQEYSDSMQEKLADVRSELDGAIGKSKKECKKVAKNVAALLRAISEDVLAQIQTMGGGSQLGTVS